MTKIKYVYKYVFLAAFYFGLMFLLCGCQLAILNPKGLIALSEKKILITSAMLMLTVVVPVIALSVIFAWRYRENNHHAKYAPNWSHNTLLEIVWWSIPCIIIAILATITWISSHELDPFKPLDNNKPLTIQVIALEWKWLFIYPEQHIATVNFVQIPLGVPVRFLITSEGPMNSLQIPQLAGQIYAMAGMQTKLNLIANAVGDYRGMSANFSGKGFYGMKFITRVSTPIEFEQWVNRVKQSSHLLTMTAYNELLQPSENVAVQYYQATTKDLFATAIMKYMMPMTDDHDKATLYVTNNNFRSTKNNFLSIQNNFIKV